MTERNKETYREKEDKTESGRENVGWRKRVKRGRERNICG